MAELVRTLRLKGFSDTNQALGAQNYGGEFVSSNNLRMESSISAQSGVRKTTESSEKVMRKGGRESEKWCANFFGGIPAGSLTRFGAGQPSSDWFGRAHKKSDSVPDTPGPKMTTESSSPWQATKPRNSLPKPYIDLKTPSVIASLFWARVAVFI